MTDKSSTNALHAENDSIGSPPRIRVGSADYCFAAFVGLAAVMVWLRVKLVEVALHSARLVPLLVYQDLFIVAALAWFFYALFVVIASARARKTIAVVGWTVCLVVAAETYASFMVYLVVRQPFTYHLLLLSDHLTGIRASLAEELNMSVLKGGAFVLTALIIVAISLIRLAPSFLKQMSRVFYSRWALIVTLIYLVAAHAWAVRELGNPTAAANPQLALASSLFRQTSFKVADKFPAADLDDFLPGGADRHASTTIPALASFSPSPAHRPLNVLVVVMESVGAHRLQLYGAPFDDTPEMIRLAQHGLLFRRMYAPQGSTSEAMAALFSSLYPYLDWYLISSLFPNLAIPSLPGVLADHGYRTAFIHSGQLEFGSQGQFLASRGFGKIIADDKDYDSPHDQELLPATINWIKADPSRPFFVAIWTQDTHHPYLAASHYDYGVGNDYLNRYLNAVHDTDALVGHLYSALKQMDLADDTLLIITGDHGEAFGEHGRTLHFSSVYDVELRIPLLIINERLFPHQSTIDSLGIQIDIAPTLLDLLGLPAPAQWQGYSMFDKNRSDRVYLFSPFGLTLGLVDGSFKYIHQFGLDRSELYDLTNDPDETNDLSSNSAFSTMMHRDLLRLEAWLSFQNKYISQFARATADKDHHALPADGSPATVAVRPRPVPAAAQ